MKQATIMKRALPLILVIAVCTTLAVGAVYMLFSSTSADASNAVEVGSGFSAVIQERHDDEAWQDQGEYAPWTTGPMQPGDTVDKWARVQRTEDDPLTSFDAYVRVLAELVYGNGDTAVPVDFGYLANAASRSSEFTFTGIEVQDLFNKILNGIQNGNTGHWRFVQNPDTTPPTSGYFYYVDSAGVLLGLVPGGATEEIFSLINVPAGDVLTGRELELFAALGLAGKSINLRLTAELVQADNNHPYNTLPLTPVPPDSPVSGTIYKDTSEGYEIAFNNRFLSP